MFAHLGSFLPSFLAIPLHGAQLSLFNFSSSPSSDSFFPFLFYFSCPSAFVCPFNCCGRYSDAPPEHLGFLLSSFVYLSP